MSRPRPGSRRRRKLRREREEPGEWVPKQEKEPAQAAADPSEASTIESTTEATTSASAPDSKDTTGETKDRHYYYRQEKFERRFVALDRCIKERVDANIVKGRAAIDADTKKQVDIRDTKKEINRLERKVDEIQEENETLRDEIARERRRMMYERYDGPSHDQ